jgi:hypothetical protein
MRLWAALIKLVEDDVPIATHTLRQVVGMRLNHTPSPQRQYGLRQSNSCLPH